MDINITAIERNLRLYGLPTFLMLPGLAGIILIDPSSKPANPFLQMVAPLSHALFFGAAGLVVVGAIWALWNAWLEYRWMRGDLAGGCDHCAGPMRHLTGRYGAYSKCLMCGNTRKGWH